MPTKVSPSPICQQNKCENRTTSPIDTVILEDFHRRSGESLFHVYDNNDQTRHFHIQPTKRRMFV